MLVFPFLTQQHATFKESMINQLSNLINLYRSAAKLSQVSCSNGMAVSTIMMEILMKTVKILKMIKLPFFFLLLVLIIVKIFMLKMTKLPFFVLFLISVNSKQPRRSKTQLHVFLLTDKVVMLVMIFFITNAIFIILYYHHHRV